VKLREALVHVYIKRGEIKKNTEETEGGELVSLEFKRMCCVTDQYVKRVPQVKQDPPPQHLSPSLEAQ
jgi:hypothetical protein